MRWQQRVARVDQVVAEQHRERLVPDVLAGTGTAWPRPFGSPWRT